MTAWASRRAAGESSTLITGVSTRMMRFPVLSSVRFIASRTAGRPRISTMMVSTPDSRKASRISAIASGPPLRLLMPSSAAALVWLYPRIQFVPMTIRERDTPATVVRGNGLLIQVHLEGGKYHGSWSLFQRRGTDILRFRNGWSPDCRHFWRLGIREDDHSLPDRGNREGLRPRPPGQLLPFRGARDQPDHHRIQLRSPRRLRQRSPSRAIEGS